MRRRGLILINTGNGKGKTTAALGAVLRAVGHGMKVLIVQFIKSPKLRSGEIKALETLDNVEVRTMGMGFTWDSQNPELDRIAAMEAWQFASERLASGEYDLIVLDEINYAIQYGLLDVDDVVEGISNRDPKVHVILTGRNAHPRLIDLADTVTEMVEIKHHFRKGMKSVKGIEF